MPDVNALMTKLHEELAHWLEHGVEMLPNLVLALLVVVLAAFASRWVHHLVHRLLLSVSRNDPISRILAAVAKLGTLTIGLFIALGLLNLDKTVTSLLAGVGVVGLALGFAFQDIAANFMAGFLMALRGPFEPGDLVEVAGHRGHVRHISLRASELETLDGLSILIPNKDIFQAAIVNFTRTTTRRMDLSIGTAYGDDMPTVRKVILGAMGKVPHRDPQREPELFFESFGDSSINFTVRVWLDRSEELPYLEARSEAMIAAKAALDAAELTIPFPIRTLDFGAGAVGGEALDSMRLRLAKS